MDNEINRLQYELVMIRRWLYTNRFSIAQYRNLRWERLRDIQTIRRSQ